MAARLPTVRVSSATPVISGSHMVRASFRGPRKMRSRKAMEAAWKRFERTGMERLRATAKIKLAENVPEDEFDDTSY